MPFLFFFHTLILPNSGPANRRLHLGNLKPSRCLHTLMLLRQWRVRNTLRFHNCSRSTDTIPILDSTLRGPVIFILFGQSISRINRSSARAHPSRIRRIRHFQSFIRSTHTVIIIVVIVVAVLVVHGRFP
ncbi:hypothetical protein AA313_de0202884 [Arthrobotrys entomopaga]|nr:hypothetical protein AA313_de0202884 [Arthrobotrys entomopaga]